MVVKIDFENTYEIIPAADDFSEATFISIDKRGNPVLMKIRIEPLGNFFLPQVYNLCFGPPSDDGLSIDDTAKIFHSDLSKVFSTIILCCLLFLRKNSGYGIGLDGSTDARAYLYHRIFLSGRVLLSEYFVSSGVDWFVRLLRNDDYERYPDGSAFFKPRPEPFDYQRPASDLYRYYMSHLR